MRMINAILVEQPLSIAADFWRVNYVCSRKRLHHIVHDAHWTRLNRCENSHAWEISSNRFCFHYFAVFANTQSNDVCRWWRWMAMPDGVDARSTYHFHSRANGVGHSGRRSNFSWTHARAGLARDERFSLLVSRILHRHCFQLSSIMAAIRQFIRSIHIQIINPNESGDYATFIAFARCLFCVQKCVYVCCALDADTPFNRHRDQLICRFCCRIFGGIVCAGRRYA